MRTTDQADYMLHVPKYVYEMDSHPRETCWPSNTIRVYIAGHIALDGKRGC